MAHAGGIRRQSRNALRKREGIHVQIKARSRAREGIADLRRTHQVAIAHYGKWEARPCTLNDIQLPAANQPISTPAIPEALSFTKRQIDNRIRRKQVRNIER